MSTEQSFQAQRAKLADIIWDWLESMNKERGVTATGQTRGSLADNPRLYTDTCYGQVLAVRQTYSAGTTVEGMDTDPERTIEIAIGHTEAWIPVVCVMSSLRDSPIEIVGGSDAALREAVQLVHGELFRDWPPTDEQIDEFMRRQ